MNDPFNYFLVPKFIPPEKFGLFELQTLVLGNCFQGYYWYVADVLTTSNFTDWSKEYPYKLIYEGIQSTNGGDLIAVRYWLDAKKAYCKNSVLAGLSVTFSCVGNTMPMALKLIELQLEEMFFDGLNKFMLVPGISNTVLGACIDLINDTQKGTPILNLVEHFPDFLQSLGATQDSLKGLLKIKNQFSIRAKRIGTRSTTFKMLADTKQFVFNHPELNGHELKAAKMHMDCLEQIFLSQLKNNLAKGEVVYE